eukprot:7295167-Prymnesium_polylepis.1
MSAADDGKAVIGRRDPIKNISLSTWLFASVPFLPGVKVINKGCCGGIRHRHHRLITTFETEM